MTSKPALLISPHPDAPMFDAPDALKVLEQLLEEVGSGRFPTSDGLLDVIRQAGLVNLWFYTKFIAGQSGPYDLINDDLHVGMCNFRQTLLDPGCRGAMYLPRGHNKTSLVSECGSAWEMTRDPGIRIRLTNAIADKAQDFLKSIKSIFEENDFVKALWPQLVPKPDWVDWNNTILTFPTSVRGKKYREGNLEYGGVGGASEGHHYDLHIVDDMIGLGALNANRGGNAVMLQTENWFWSSEKPLLSSMRTGRVIVVGTRYANDDVYSSILKQANSVEGYPMVGFEANPEGRWRVYYRKAIEGDRVIYPEQYTIEGYEEQKKTDYWTFVTQYLNEPSASGLAELVNYEALPANLDFDNSTMEWTLYLPGVDAQGVPAEIAFPLYSCYVSQAGDPAATERYISAKTSRSANAVIAVTPDDRVVVIDGHADYVAPSMFFSWLFQAKKRFKDHLQVTWLEANAGFKVLGPFLREEEKKQKVFLNLRPFASASDKDARIRSALQPLLERKGLYAVEAVQKLLNGELVGFPQSRRKDFLDALATAVTKRIVPQGADAREAKKKAKIKWLHRTTNRAGY